VDTEWYPPLFSCPRRFEKLCAARMSAAAEG
jgi:hypothetical protein